MQASIFMFCCFEFYNFNGLFFSLPSSQKEFLLFVAQVVLSIPSVVIGCEPRSGYASMHLCWPTHWHFCLLADASQEVLFIIFSCALGQ